MSCQEQTTPERALPDCNERGVFALPLAPVLASECATAPTRIGVCDSEGSDQTAGSSARLRSWMYSSLEEGTNLLIGPLVAIASRGTPRGHRLLLGTPRCVQG